MHPTIWALFKADHRSLAELVVGIWCGVLPKAASAAAEDYPEFGLWDDSIC